MESDVSRMYKKISLRYFLPTFLAFLLLLLFFLVSPFSQAALLGSLIFSLYLIAVSLILNERAIMELSRSFLYVTHKLVYSLAFFALSFILFALAVDRFLYLLQTLGAAYSLKYSFIVTLTLGVGGYTCLSFLVWFISTRLPSGISYKIFLKENALKLSVIGLAILGVFFVVFLLLSPFFLDIIPGLLFSRSVFGLILLIVLIHIDFSEVAFKTIPKGPCERQKNKLFLIGIDAADWKVVRPLLDMDKLPHLQKILENASYGYLDCFGERLSPVLWTSFITGATTDVHGISGFVFHQKGKKEPLLYKSYHRKVPALWHILSAAGKKVGVVNWLLSFPAEQINGHMVSRFNPESPDGQTFPESLHDELASLMKTTAPDRKNSQEAQDLHEINEELGVLERISAFLLEKNEYDAFLFYTQTTDKIMHKFWHFKEPGRFTKKDWELDSTKIKKFSTAIDDHWCRLDDLIGKILAKSDSDTNIVIISDHGSKARAQPFFFVDGNKLLESLGLLKFKDDGQSIDFSRTRLYMNDPTIWNTFYAFSLNKKGREESGIIEEENFEEERQKVIQYLRSIRTKKGRRIFGSIKAVDIDGTDILAGHSSLLRKQSEETLPIHDQEVPLKKLISRAEGDSGNHDPRGLVILSGPAFDKKIIGASLIEHALSFVLSYVQGLSPKKGIRLFFEIMKRIKLIDPYNTLDVMPTLLHIMDLPIAGYMPGRIMAKLLSLEYKKKLNFHKIKKYDISLPERSEYEQESKEDQKIKEQLRGLGYLG